MEYAAGGELFDRICQAGRFSEPEARYFFQQLISGVHYCHNMVLTLFFISFLILVLCIKFVIVFHYIYIQQICHRDLKLENTLLDGSPAPRLKICDFGYSKVLRFYIIFSAYISLSLYINNDRSTVICVAFTSQVNCWNTSLYCTGGSIAP